jgi:hypothetical protein
MGMSQAASKGLGYTLQVHTPDGERGYTLHVHTTGGGKGYTLHVDTASCGCETLCMFILLALEHPACQYCWLW